MIRSWVTRFLGIDTVLARVDGVEKMLAQILAELKQRRDIEADTVRRLREINRAVEEGRVSDDDLVNDLELADFDPQLGV